MKSFVRNCVLALAVAFIVALANVARVITKKSPKSDSDSAQPTQWHKIERGGLKIYTYVAFTNATMSDSDGVRMEMHNANCGNHLATFTFAEYANLSDTPDIDSVVDEMIAVNKRKFKDVRFTTHPRGDTATVIAGTCMNRGVAVAFRGHTLISASNL